MKEFTDIKSIRSVGRGVDSHLSTLAALEAAWIILLAQYTHENNVEYYTVAPTPRNGASRSLSDGNTLYCAKISVNWRSTVSHFVRQFEDRAQEHENQQDLDNWDKGMPLLWIRSNKTIDYHNKVNVADGKSTLVLLCTTLQDGLDLQMAFDGSSSGKLSAERMMSQMEHILQQLVQCNDASKPLGDFVPYAETDLETFWSSTPETGAEQQLRAIWASILGILPASIGRDDSFFDLGGDSIAAIQLVAAAERSNSTISVTDIFKAPRLSDQAKYLAASAQTDFLHNVEPFSLINSTTNEDSAREQASVLCGIEAQKVCDVFPCTPLQEGLLALTARRDGDYIGRLSFDLLPTVDPERFVEAWRESVASLQILRTRIIDLKSLGLMQVVVDIAGECERCGHLEEYLATGARCIMDLGTPLCRAALIEESGSGRRLFVLVIHHALYDGWTIPMILQTIEKRYWSHTIEQPPPLQLFVRYLQNIDTQAATRFWEQQLAGSEAAIQFPLLPSPAYQPKSQSVIEHEIDNLSRPNGDFTVATAVRATWALLQARYTDADQVVFGSVVTGRYATVPGIERIAGPTMATVPVHVKIDWEMGVEGLLQQIHMQAIEMTPFEQTGLQHIARVSEEARIACNFQTLLVVQPMAVDHSQEESKLFVRTFADSWASDGTKEANDVANTYGIMLECTLRKQGLGLRISFDPIVIGSRYIQRLAQRLEHVLRQICSPRRPEMSLKELDLISKYDVHDIWNWNSVVPTAVNDCVHNLITDVAHKQPNATAIDAWDGKLSYSELDQLSSKVAQLLSMNFGVGSDTIIPLCFEKSVWTPVAMLGVMKTGAASVAIDKNQPEERLRAITSQVNAKVILCSQNIRLLASRLADGIPVIVVDRTYATQLDSMSLSPISPPHISATSRLYVTFTSGSTGVPKGVVITHSNFCSAIRHQQIAFKLDSTIRFFDFAPYAFDTAWATILCTLTAGGCLCTPSDQGLQEPEISMRNFHVNYAGMTPTVARMLRPERLPHLRTLVLGGEVVRLADFERWSGKVSLVNAYGPSECTPTATIHYLESIGLTDPHIGRPYGLCAWVVEPKTADKLMGVGEIGELWLEGPLVGSGYLNDREKTAMAFIEDPPWLLRLGRRGCLYRTGDLVRYRPDGSLDFIGRKDSQVKVRGQRVELSEVEYHIQRLLNESKEVQVVAEVLTLQGSNKPALVAFIVPGGSTAAVVSEEELWTAMHEMTDGLDDQLAAHCPSYMIPTGYIALRALPRTTTGKTDRQRLRLIGAATAIEKITSIGTSSRIQRQPTTESEVHLRDLWASTLGVPAVKIMANDSFLRLGGDSISAMRLAKAARENGQLLTVADILRNPRLSELALKIVKTSVNVEKQSVAAFSMLGEGVEMSEARLQAASLCNVEARTVRDVFPCTSLQEGLLAMTARRAGAYIARFVFELVPEIDVKQLQQAWEDTARRSQILQTRIVDLPSHGLMQVVVDEPQEWRFEMDMETYINGKNQRNMGLGTPLCRLGIVKQKDTGKLILIVIMHHALYDGWSLPLLLNAVRCAYQSGTCENLLPMQNFVRYTLNLDKSKMDQFWETELAGSLAVPFPTLPSSTYQPQANGSINRKIRSVTWSSGFTASTVIRGAWALLQARYTDVDEAVFGAVVTGRQVPVVGAELIAGPTIATVPLRIVLSPESTVSQLLGQIHEQAIEMIAYEQAGLSRIRQLSEDTNRCCRFQSLLVVQPEESETLEQSASIWREDRDGVIGPVTDRYSVFNTYAVMIICQLHKGDLDVDMSYDSGVIDERQARRILAQFEHILRQMAAPESSQTVQEVTACSSSDFDDIWQWNRDVDSGVDACLHDLVSKMAQNQPEAVAIHSWDGDLRYGEMDDISSQLAFTLIELQVQIGDIIPVCFEKTKWMYVAMLAVMKAGAAFNLLTPLMARGRLDAVIKTVDPKLVITDRRHSSLFPHLIIVTPDQMPKEKAGDQRSVVAWTASPSSPAAVCFTSGTTGTPKGILLSHRSIATTALVGGRIAGASTAIRIFQFASYVFDSVLYDTFIALMYGGCICVPSEHDRNNNTSRVMRQLQVNWAFMTPSMINAISVDSVPTLKTLIFTGEALKESDILRWKDKVQIFNWYGPTECALCTMTEVTPGTWKTGVLGPGTGTTCWVVEREAPHTLAAVGAIGELVAEGAQLAIGYLNNSEKTKTAFIQDPPWLLQRSPRSQESGRRGRVYRTGDLVRYNSDGTLLYIGRKDAQVKIRGQRVELQDVEHHVRMNVPEDVEVVAETIIPRKAQAAILVAFLVAPKVDYDSTKEVLKFTEGLEDILAEVLPNYMIPTAYIPIEQVPRSPTGKTDRQRLREMGSGLSLDQLMASKASSDERQPPETTLERRLQALWASTLRIKPTSISKTDSFLQIGGDSIAAMRLVATAREQGMIMTVADVFTWPRLSDLAAVVSEGVQLREDDIEPFSLLKGISDVDAQKETAKLCGVETAQVKDVLPCTALQAGLLALTAQRAGDYVARNVFELRASVDADRFQVAWEKVAIAAPILRTRIVDLERHGVMQVVVDEPMRWSSGNDIATYIQADRQNSIGLGTPLVWMGIVEENQRRFFIWTMHHALYDGWSRKLLLQMVTAAYQGKALLPSSPFQNFIDYVLKSDEERAVSVWRSQFDGMEAQPFPQLPSTNYQPKADSEKFHHIEGLQWHKSDVTASTAVRTALAIWVARYTDTDDVVFGATVAGREAPVSGIERITGPTIATVPVRIALGSEENLGQLLARVQAQAIETAMVAQLGLQRIRRVSEAAEQACKFQTLLTVQPPNTRNELGASSLLVMSRKGEDENEAAGLRSQNTNVLLLYCELEDKGLSLQISFDSTVIGVDKVQRMTRQFEHILRQVCEPSSGTKKLAEIEMVCDTDLQDIWRWNAKLPETVQTCVHDQFAIAVQKQPQAQAVCAWNGELTYRQLDELSTRLAYYLVELGVGPEVIVQLYFEKSMWTPVAILGVMKAGGASVTIDTTLPEERLRTIAKQVKGPVALSSAANEMLAKRLVNCRVTVAVPEELIQQLKLVTEVGLPTVNPSNMLYVVFTSGSTGTPKGAMITHSSFSTAIRHQQKTLGIMKTSRVYDFASYAFDVAWFNTLHSLTAGACLCIPNEEDRRGDLSGSIRRLQANYVHLTTSVTRLIDPSQIPGIQHINFGGEPVLADDLAQWTSFKGRLSNTYGPAECTITSTLSNVSPSEGKEASIGKGIGVNTWVVESTGLNLAPIGALGELWLEGPLVGRGYLGDAEKTAAVFVMDPPWLVRGGPGHPGRHGLLYRTGDLVKYDEDGTLMFVRRKDGQVKNRGQRVELREVAYHVLQRLSRPEGEGEESFADSIQVVAEMVRPRGGDRDKLVAFVIPKGGTMLTEEDLAATVAQLTRGLDDRLAAAVPSYMIPNAYIPLASTPMTATGKTDHRRLRDIGSALSLEQLVQLTESRPQLRIPPSTEAEKQLQQLWASILNIDPNLIGANDNFFRLGGDSIQAMRLVANARRNGWPISLADVLKRPLLSQMAICLDRANHTSAA